MLVTGGNRGIGLAICRELAQRGARVLAGARDPAAMPEVPGDVTPLAIDLAHPDSIAEAAAAAGEVSMIAPAVLYAAWVARMRGGAVALRSAFNGSSVVAGIATFTAYALVLAALERASAASLAAVRETSVVIATLAAAVVLKEHVTPARLTGAILVVCGVALLAAGG